MGRRLTSINPIGYLGVSAPNPPNMLREYRRPTFRDINYALGTFWFIPKQSAPPSEELWQLTSQENNVAEWIELSSGGGSVPGPQYSLLTSDGSGSFGSNIGPATAGYILVAGGASDYPDFIQATAGHGLTLTANASTFEYSLDVPISIQGGGTGQTDLDEFNVLIGNGTNGITQVPPSSTAGIPLVSKGLAADPEFDTAEVVGGGTGQTSWTANQIVVGGTSSTGALQQIPAGSAGQYLQSTGAGVPTWANGTGFSSINVQVFDTPGSSTYNSAANTLYVIVECIGGGGAGQGNNTGGSVSGGGGGGGAYCRKVIDVATADGQTVTVGAGGVGTNSNTAPTNSGEPSSFGSIMTAGGGSGSLSRPLAGAGGIATGGDININGQSGTDGSEMTIVGGFVTYTLYAPGNGGNSFYGNGGQGNMRLSGSRAGQNGVGYGAGGSSTTGPSTNLGGSGANGAVIITEFIA